MPDANNLAVTYTSVNSLIPYANNSRTHDGQQVAQIAASIREFGFTNPILVDSDNSIIAGHGKLQAARLLNINSVPTITLDGLSDTQKRAYIIADNKLALNAGWDNELLMLELDALKDEGYDLDLTGFSTDEISDLMPEQLNAGLTDEDAVPDVPVNPVTVLGDAVDMVYTDPPYGISIVSNGSVGGSKPFGSVDGSNIVKVNQSNIVKVNQYAPIAGDDSIDVAIEAIQVIQTLNAQVEIIWGGNYYASHLDNSSCWIVWDKKNTGNFADAELAWTNQKTAVRVFQHMWNGMIKASEHGQKRVHPTQKPIALAEWCYDNYGKDCETVLDLFAGSGSSLIACETKRKHGYMMELSPAYCDVIIKRWQDFTGKKAIHADTGLEFP